MSQERRRATVCAAIALAIGGSAVLASLSVRDWRVSALVRMSAEEPMARLARTAMPDFAFVHPEAHYDGVYFYTIARDPFARGEAHMLIDRSAYRYGHAGYGWLAWLASAGRAAAVPAALLIVGLVAIAVAAYAASLLAREFGWSSWGGLVVALSPGAIFALTADTSEPVMMAAAALALLAWRRRQWGRAAVALAAMCLTKEPLVLIPAGLLTWEVLEWLRGRRADDLVKRIAALAIGPILLAGWLLYVHVTLDASTFTREAQDFFTWPFVGWVDSMRRAATSAAETFQAMQTGHASVALLAVTGGALLLGMVRAARLRSWLDPIYFLYALLIFCLTWLGVQYPKDLIREAAVPLALLPAVLVGPREPVSAVMAERFLQG